jgi:hypothetical protein
LAAGEVGNVSPLARTLAARRLIIGDETSLTDLVRNRRMLVHPPDIRSPSPPDTRIVEWEIDDPGAGQAGAPFRGRRPPLIPRPRR